MFEEASLILGDGRETNKGKWVAWSKRRKKGGG